jgi:uncharacterized protein (TIGR02246 family)
VKGSILARRIAVATFAGALGAARALGAEALPPSDDAKIRAVIREYERAWLANDEEGVLRLFTEDAVLLPHHGVEPRVGKKAARAFWFPKSGPPTAVTELSHTIDETGGSGDIAYLRGHSRVAWTSGTGADAKKSGNEGTLLVLLRRQPDGSWRISHQMWDDPPNQTR